MGTFSIFQKVRSKEKALINNILSFPWKDLKLFMFHNDGSQWDHFGVGGQFIVIQIHYHHLISAITTSAYSMLTSTSDGGAATWTGRHLITGVEMQRQTHTRTDSHLLAFRVTN